MVNERLVQYLENNKLIINLQCGFRSIPSTLDHLIRLDTFIKQALAEGKIHTGYFLLLRKSVVYNVEIRSIEEHAPTGTERKITNVYPIIYEKEHFK